MPKSIPTKDPFGTVFPSKQQMCNFWNVTQPSYDNDMKKGCTQKQALHIMEGVEVNGYMIKNLSNEDLMNFKCKLYKNGANIPDDRLELSILCAIIPFIPWMDYIFDRNQTDLEKVYLNIRFNDKAYQYMALILPECNPNRGQRSSIYHESVRLFNDNGYIINYRTFCGIIETLYEINKGMIISKDIYH